MSTPLLGLRTVIYHVARIDEAKAWWTEFLGYPPYFDQPFYVGFNVAGYELGMVPASDDAGGSIAWWGVDDVEVSMAQAVAVGASVHAPVEDVGEGILTGAVRTPQGNLVGFIHNPHFPRLD